LILARFTIVAVLIATLISCASNQNKDFVSSKEISVNEFSSSVGKLITNLNFLEDEILKINAKNPSVQRIVAGSDKYIKEGKLVQANSELERALRISKQESAVYLRLSLLRFNQGLVEESKSFASRGLLIRDVSSWERLLLNVFLKFQL
tara:strand:+ start:12093 stop:12539 length:447 start_codon:yes stop_codon:yes gene_type:complete